MVGVSGFDRAIRSARVISTTEVYADAEGQTDILTEEVGAKSPAHALIILGPPSDTLARAIASACAGLLTPTSVVYMTTS